MPADKNISLFWLTMFLHFLFFFFTPKLGCRIMFTELEEQLELVDLRLPFSLVSQYEVDWNLQIQKLMGQKLPQEVLVVFLDRVTEAKRISLTKIKETGGHKRRRRRGSDELDNDVHLGFRKGNSSKMPKRK